MSTNEHLNEKGFVMNKLTNTTNGELKVVPSQNLLGADIYGINLKLPLSSNHKQFLEQAWQTIWFYDLGAKKMLLLKN